MAKRDFIFIDESGEPGEETSYYIQGLLHVTDKSLKKINIHLGALRYFGNIRAELKSTKLNKLQKEKLLDILECSVGDNDFVKASSVFVNKENYTGKYLREKLGVPKDTARFEHFIMRRLLESHFQENKPQSNEIEIVIDRFHSSELKEQQMRNYLRRLSSLGVLPKFLHIIQADSRYIELLQVTDWIAGSVKEKIFTHPNRKYGDLFKYIKIKEITN